MKFNLALIAAVATSSMLMSSVSAFTDCQASNRMDAAGGVTVTSVADCGANCLANSCQVATSFDATKDCVAEANLSGMQCDGNLAKCTNKNHEIVNGACVPTQALLDARTACDANLGKKLDEDTLVCACEHGDDNGVCKCSNHEQEVRDNNGTCTARPEVDCAKLNRGASIRQSGDKRAYLPEHCDVCTNTTHCMLPDGKCIAAPKDGKCENGKVVCNADFELKGESCEAKPTPPPANTGADKEEKKDEEESKDADKKNPKKEKTAEQKCKDLHRVFKDDKCGDCDGSRKAVSDGGMCYETVTEDKCKENAKETFRHFDSDKKLCVCDNGKKPEKENEESHLTAKCINGAGRLLVSSVVLLSSVAATAVFFL